MKTILNTTIKVEFDCSTDSIINRWPAANSLIDYLKKWKYNYNKAIFEVSLDKEVQVHINMPVTDNPIFVKTDLVDQITDFAAYLKNYPMGKIKIVKLDIDRISEW